MGSLVVQARPLQKVGVLRSFDCTWCRAGFGEARRTMHDLVWFSSPQQPHGTLKHSGNERANG